jgi:DNA-binding YbaB/EbfC family protein
MNMKTNLNQLLKQAQQMQTKMQEAQEQLTKLVIMGEAGAGMVKVQMNGRHDVQRVHLQPGFSKEEIEIQEDLIAAAINDAVQKVEKASREKLNTLTAGIQLPTGFGDGSLPGSE